MSAIFELFFVDFLFVCSTRDSAEMLSTICVNIFIGLWLIAALPGGFLADYCLGNYRTQALSAVVTTASVWLILLSSWQFSVTKPSCCVSMPNMSDVAFLTGSSSTHSMSGSLGVHEVLLGEEGLVASSLNHGNCSELTRNILFPQAALGLPPFLLMALCLTAMVVRTRIHENQDYKKKIS